MHHQDYTGDPPGTATRRTAFHYRRGSSSASGSPSSSVGGNPAEESSGSAQAGPSSSSTALQALGAQVKKKSGFQITSVTSAQISGNNSLADDTESYDDMDESHTEDLSSSEMLDVSAPRAADAGVPERSSSEETLNSLHGVDTPGLVSPNEPLQLHQVAQGSSLVNGSVHHQFYPHHSDPALPTLPVPPVASSSPALVQRPLVQESPKPAGSAAPAANVQNVAKASNISGTGSDNTAASGQATQGGHSQPAPGSRFRVVKLDTNSEPFRKGRWTCTEYYEKEVPHPAPSEAPKAADVAGEVEAGNAGAGLAVPAALQPYHPPTQDFASPQAAAQTAPQSYVTPQEVVGTPYMPKPLAPPAGVPAAASSQPPSVIPYSAEPQPQGGYPAPQLHTGVDVTQAGVRQPDFIQPTAPFQTQVQPPLPRVNTGISAPVPGIPLQHPISMTPQLQGQVAPPPPTAFTSVQPQPHPLPKAQLQHPSAATALQGVPYNPLTTLQADLQPLLTLGANLGHVPGGGGGGSFAKNAELENAKKLLIQHQRLLGLPRLGIAAGGEGAAEGHTGMSVEARVFMAAAGFRSQHAEGDDDSSSGASVVAIDNKIEQAMDLVKSHLMYAVREEVEVLKEQIKELMERNSQLEQENNLLKTLASPEQMAQFQAQVQTGGSPTGAAQPPAPSGPTQVLPSTQNSSTSG